MVLMIHGLTIVKAAFPLNCKKVIKFHLMEIYHIRVFIMKLVH